MTLLTRETLRIALRRIADEQNLDATDLSIKFNVDVRTLAYSYRGSIRKKDGKHRVSWDRLLTWLKILGYEVHFTIVKKGTYNGTQVCEEGRATSHSKGSTQVNV